MANDIFEKTNNSLAWTPEEALKDALESYEKGERYGFTGKSCVIIALDKTKDKYQYGWNLAGLTGTQLQALLQNVIIDINKMLDGE